MLAKPEILALEWRVWPLQQQGLRPRAIAVLLLAGLIWLLLLVSLPVITGIALGIALLVSLLPYYLPTHYRIDQEGIIASRGLGLIRRKRKWFEFTRYETRPGGYLLSPFVAASQPNRLEPFRALWIPDPTDSAATLLLRELVESHFQK